MHLEINQRLDRSPTRFNDLQVELRTVWNSLRPSVALRKLSFRNCLPALQGEEVAASNCLRTLSIENVHCDYGRVLQILSQCPNLETLLLSIQRPPSTQQPEGILPPAAPDTALAPVPLPDHPITFCSLSRLSMHQMDTGSCQILLQHMHTPNLTFFSLWNRGLSEIHDRIAKGEKTYDIMAPFGEAVIAFTAKAPQLQTFHVTNSVLPDRHLLQVLGHMTSLEELHLTMMNVGSLIFRGLSRPSTSNMDKDTKSMLCRSLRRLSLVGCDFVTDDHILDVVLARNGSDSTTVPITFLDIRQCCKVSQKGLRSVRGNDMLLYCTGVLTRVRADGEDKS